MILIEEFKNPSSKYRIKPFWFWNGEMTKQAWQVLFVAGHSMFIETTEQEEA